MRTRRIMLGALALTIGLSSPAWAIWEGIMPLSATMPSWTQDGIDRQEQLQQLTPEERSRLDRMPGSEQEQALRTLSQQHRPDRTTESGGRQTRRPSQSGKGGELQPESDQGGESGERSSMDMQQAPESGGEADEAAPDRVHGTSPDEPTRQPPVEPGSGDRAPSGAQTRSEAGTVPGGEGGMIRQQVELKPIPKQDRPPAPGEPTMPDNPIDAARAHIGMAHTSVQAQDWDAARNHVRQAEEALDRISASGNRVVDHYVTTLKDDMRRAEQAIGNRSRDVDEHLDQLDSRLRNMRVDVH